MLWDGLTINGADTGIFQDNKVNIMAVDALGAVSI